MESYKEYPDYIHNGTFSVKRLAFDSINSTQTYSTSHQLVDHDKENKLVVVTANTQTAGIGSHSRKWRSDIPGNVLASISFSSKLLPTNKTITYLTQIGTIAVDMELNNYLPPEKRAFTKWPNDVFVNNKKICGILTQFGPSYNGATQITTGIGCNINLSQDVLDSIDQPATSLSAECNNKAFDCELITFNIVKNFIELIHKYQQLPKQFGLDLKSNLMEWSGNICVFDDETQKEITGQVKSVNEDGFLEIQEESNGKLFTIKSGTLRKIKESI